MNNVSLGTEDEFSYIEMLASMPVTLIWGITDVTNCFRLSVSRILYLINQSLIIYLGTKYRLIHAGSWLGVARLSIPVCNCLQLSIDWPKNMAIQLLIRKIGCTLVRQPESSRLSGIGSPSGSWRLNGQTGVAASNPKSGKKLKAEEPWVPSKS
jgi:hypothetical protein